MAPTVPSLLCGYRSWFVFASNHQHIVAVTVVVVVVEVVAGVVAGVVAVVVVVAVVIAVGC